MSGIHQELIERCLRLEARAQRQLYEMFAPEMMAVCARYAHSLADAEDMLQEGFVKVFRNLKHYRDQGYLGAWIRRIMINNAIDHLRRGKPRQQQAELYPSVAMDETGDALELIQAEELMRMIRELPGGYRMVFNLYAVEGYSHAEIGEQLGITESTSRSQYARARALLQQRIRQSNRSTYPCKDVV
ncbi:MAG: RNA polymerase sigma factor [Bacteroidia bacterium]